MRISTKYAPRKVGEGQPLSCTKETSLKPDQMLELYRYLKLTRLVEERSSIFIARRKWSAGFFVHWARKRRRSDRLTRFGLTISSRRLIRDLGAVLVKGIRPRDIFAQYMAKAWGPSGGRDLNVHFGDMEKGFIGPISHLGDMIPVMTGILLGARMQKKEIVGRRVHRRWRHEHRRISRRH